MSRGAYTLDPGDGPARLALLCAVLVLESWDLWREWHEPTFDPITAEECWAFCDYERPQSWAPDRCECVVPPTEQSTARVDDARTMR